VGAEKRVACSAALAFVRPYNQLPYVRVVSLAVINVKKQDSASTSSHTAMLKRNSVKRVAGSGVEKDAFTWWGSLLDANRMLKTLIYAMLSSVACDEMIDEARTSTSLLRIASMQR
jgi:hypothetical protein